MYQSRYLECRRWEKGGCLFLKAFTCLPLNQKKYDNQNNLRVLLTHNSGILTKLA